MSMFMDMGFVDNIIGNRRRPSRSVATAPGVLQLESEHSIRIFKNAIQSSSALELTDMHSEKEACELNDTKA